MNSISNIGKNVKNAVVKDGSFEDLLDKNLGLFLDCKEIAGDQASVQFLITKSHANYLESFLCLQWKKTKLYLFALIYMSA